MLEVPLNAVAFSGMTVPRLDETGEKVGRRRKDLWQQGVLNRRPSFSLSAPADDGPSFRRERSERAEPPPSKGTHQAGRNLPLTRARIYDTFLPICNFLFNFAHYFLIFAIFALSFSFGETHDPPQKLSFIYRLFVYLFQILFRE